MKGILLALFLLLLGVTGKADNPTENIYPKSKLDSIKEINFQIFKSKTNLYLESNELQIFLHENTRQDLIHRSKRLQWHAFASNVIFWVVLAIVFVGIFFSGIQFYLALKKHKEKIPGSKQHLAALKPAEAPQHDGEDNDMKVTMKLSSSGIEVSSSVLGIIILTISIAFFYLYLTFVYPINDMKQADSKENTTSKKESEK